MWVMPRSQTQGPREIRVTFILFDLTTSQGYSEASVLLATSHSLLNKFLFFYHMLEEKAASPLSHSKSPKTALLEFDKEKINEEMIDNSMPIISPLY